MTAASAAAVEAAQQELGCSRYQWRHLIWSDDYCVEHPGDGADLGWTDRGCPVAVRVADAVVEAQEAAEREAYERDVVRRHAHGMGLDDMIEDGSPVEDEVADEPCPDCGNDPSDYTLHAEGCRRIGTDIQCGPPWKPWQPEGGNHV